MGSRVSFKAVRVGAGVLGLALAVSACGGQMKMGAAATFSDGRISNASLDDDVNTWTKEFFKTPTAGQLRKQAESQSQSGDLPYDPTSPTRTLLNWLVSFKVWDEVAAEQKITVTAAQVDNAVQAKGGQRWLDVVPLALGMPKSDGRTYMRMLIIEQSVYQAAGLPSDEQAQSQLTQQQATAIALRVRSVVGPATRALKVDVNPRYGSYPLLATAGQPAYRLSKPDPGLSGSSALGG